jgi:hypothetical protein
MLHPHVGVRGVLVPTWAPGNGSPDASTTPLTELLECPLQFILGDEVEAVHVVAPLEVFDAFLDGFKQPSPFLRIEIISIGSNSSSVPSGSSVGSSTTRRPFLTAALRGCIASRCGSPPLDGPPAWFVSMAAWCRVLRVVVGFGSSTAIVRAWFPLEMRGGRRGRTLQGCFAVALATLHPPGVAEKAERGGRGGGQGGRSPEVCAGS